MKEILCLRTLTKFQERDVGSYTHEQGASNMVAEQLKKTEEEKNEKKKKNDENTKKDKETSTTPSCSGPIPAQKSRANSVPGAIFSHLMFEMNFYHFHSFSWE